MHHAIADAAARSTAAKAKISRMSGIDGEDVVEPLEEVADLAAEEAGERAEHGADQGGQQRGEHADGDRDLRALDRLGEHVAAEPVAAEGQGRRRFGVSVVLYCLARSAHSL